MTGGFTLIELSIVMAIIGVMVASALGAYKVVIVKEYRDTTLDRMEDVREALTKFKAQHDRLPCAADMYAAPGSASFGMEAPACVNAIPGPVGATGTVTVRSIIGGSVITDTVRRGAVPVRALGLSNEHAFDSWGRRFVYAVSEKLADAGYTPYNPNNGAITVLDPAGAAKGPIPDRSPFVVYSPGKTGAGGVTRDGKMYPIPCPGSGPEADNCNAGTANVVFRDGTYSEASGASRFDDYIIYSLSPLSGGGGGAEWIDDLGDGISDRTTTRSNVFLGDGSGIITAPSGIKGISNTAVGIDTLNANVDGSENTAMGRNALLLNVTGASNLAAGNSAMHDNVSGRFNTVAGSSALYANKTNEGSTAIGYEAMRYANDSTAYALTHNTALGYRALMGSSTAAANTGNYNTALGSTALLANTSGFWNTATGAAAMAATTFGSYNTATGAYALTANTFGARNLALGAEALRANVSGSDNAASGYQALFANISGNENTATGSQALYTNSTGNYNTATGSAALYFNLNGSYNTADGAGALVYNSSGSNNTAVGMWALQMNTAGGFNTAMGVNALSSNKANSQSTAVGFQSMLNADDRTTGRITYNTAIGYRSLSGTSPASANTGQYNTAAGHSALHVNTSGASNTATGASALEFNTSGNNNTAHGYYALRVNNGGGYNTAIGSLALSSNTSGGFNAAVGAWALRDNQGGSNNAAFGTSALQFNIGGSENTALGTAALLSNTAGVQNTAIGDHALTNATGSYNTAAGVLALGSLTTGTYNTALGYNANVASGSLTNATAIGANASVNTSNKVRVGSSAVTVIEGQVAWSFPSDRRLKQDIAESDLGLDFLEKLRPVSYRLKQGNGRLDYGFIAQDVEQALGGRVTNMIVQQDDEMKSYIFRSGDLLAPIVRAIQEVVGLLRGQDQRIHDQQAKIDTISKIVSEMKAEVEALRHKKAEGKAP